MKKIIYLLLLLVSAASAQNYESSIINYSEIIYSEVITLPHDSRNEVYLSFRVPYNRIVFEKRGDQFEAGYRIVFELFKDSLNFVERQISENTITALSFEQTDSGELSDEGFVKFSPLPGQYKIIPVLTDLKTNREIHLQPIDLNLQLKEEIYSPVIVKNEKGCGNADFRLVNYKGSYPLNAEANLILIPLDSAFTGFSVQVKNNGKVLNSKYESGKNNFDGLINCGKGIFLNKSGDNNINYLQINPAQQIEEGNVEILVKDKNEKVLKDVSLNAVWFNKPRTLRDPKTAVELIEYIDEAEYQKIKDASGKEADSLFRQFWKKYDPTPGTAFNELMNEFYTRADYAAKNFNSITGKDGLESDRGKIYIKFGKPEKIERTSDSNGKVVEIWTYPNRKKFSFIDEKGTGEFDLLEG